MRAPVDVVVVGGGVIGCACAWFLAREGVSVGLVERDDLAAGASGAAAGMLLPFGESGGPGPFFSFAERSLAMFGPLCAELRSLSGVDPELETCGALHVALGAADAQRLQGAAASLPGRRLEWLDARTARALEPLLGRETEGALLAPDEAHVRSPLLARALAGAAEVRGARIERGVTCHSLVRDGTRVTGIECSDGRRSAGCVVLCAGVGSPSAAPFALPIEPVRGQILSLDNVQPPLRRMLVGPDAYLVPKRDGSVVLGASEERVGFDRRVTAEGLRQLLAAAPRLAPAFADARFRDAWAGLRPCTPDRLPVVDRAPGLEGLIVASGHHRNGVLLAPATGQLVADLVHGKALPHEARAFRADRFGPAAHG